MQKDYTKWVWGGVAVVVVVGIILIANKTNESEVPPVVDTTNSQAEMPVVKTAAPVTKKPMTQTPTQVITPTPKPTGNVVELTDKGFVPSTLEIKRGESVEFRNSSSMAMVIHGSTDKPETTYPGFSQESGPLGRGGKFYFAFTTAGAWPFYNLNTGMPTSKYLGVIIVK
ncbi:MAG: hypothetical protein V4467_04140 [Patescibacteria group bacterium]